VPHFNGIRTLAAKLGSPKTVGQLAFALAVTAPLFMMTNLSLRAVQATNVTGRYHLSDYIALRLSSTTTAILGVLCIFAL